MKLEPLDRHYANCQIKYQRHTFTKPTPQRAYIKILETIANYNGEYCPHAFLWNCKSIPSCMILPELEAARFIDHYREGRYTFWKITDEGRALIECAYAKK